MYYYVYSLPAQIEPEVISSHLHIGELELKLPWDHYDLREVSEGEYRGMIGGK